MTAEQLITREGREGEGEEGEGGRKRWKGRDRQKERVREYRQQ